MHISNKYSAKDKTGIVVGKIESLTLPTKDVNSQELMKNSLVKLLDDNDLLWKDDSYSKLVMNVKILDYDEGNAFKRWMMPGWGATKLSITAEILENDNVIADSNATYKIYAGGVYSIGAWKKVFDNIAEVIVEDFKDSYEDMIENRNKK